MSDQTKCLTCGQSVRISVSEEGTGCFFPDEPDRIARLEARIERLRVALEFECGDRCHVEYNPCNAREALAADDDARSGLLPWG